MRFVARADAATHTLPGRRRLTMLAALLATGATYGCSEGQGPGQSSELPATLFVVSSPVPGASVAPSVAGSASFHSSLASSVVYVSLPPGTMPDGRTATIEDAHLGSSASVAIVDGGFDPVSLPAAVGDTLVVTVQGVGGRPTIYRQPVMRERPPIVVRTYPAQHKRDVPLNVRIIVVFSEPIDPATLTGASVHLSSGGVVVTGQLRFSDSARTAPEFVPAAPLAQATEYELVVTRDIRGLDGDALGTPLSVQFTTVDPNAPATQPWPYPVSRAVPYESGGWVFVSAPPGSLPTDTWVSIINARSKESNGASSRLGRFDPIPVRATTGDTLLITVNQAGGIPVLDYRTIVPAVSTPTVLRSDPASGNTSARLGTDLLIVFTEPVATTELDDLPPNSARLQAGETTIAGHWMMVGIVPGIYSIGSRAAFSWVFTPATPLTAGTSYELVLTQDIRGDRSGSPMAAQVVIPFTVENPPPGPSDAVLKVESFSIIEFQYPTDPTRQYYYAPQLQLAEVGGRSGATVVKMQFTIPGFGSGPDVCSSGTAVPAGQSTEMFGAWRGSDYEWSYFTPGSRAAAGPATTAIVFRDGAGRTDTLRAEGPITPGFLPSLDPPRDTSHPEYFAGSDGCQPIFAAKTAAVVQAASSPRHVEVPRTGGAQ